MFTAAINYGIVVDSLTKERRQLNVGIMGDKIAVLSETPLEAERVINAAGMIVSPGFIDVHGHVDGDRYAGELSVCQGITTTVGGNCGFSPADLKEFFDAQDAQGFPIHQAMFIGHGEPLRELAGVKDRYTGANEEQIRKMAEYARKGLEDGACGVSFGLDYIPGCDLREVIELASLCRQYDRICPVHTRLLTEEDLYSLYELFLAARKSGARFLISHFVYQYCCGLVDEGLRMVEKAQQEGLSFYMDTGMYTNWATYFNTATFDIENIRNNNWSWDRMVVATGKYKGSVMNEELYYRMREECPQESVIFFEGREYEIYKCMEKSYAMPSTDAGAYAAGEGHPQIAGTFPKYFREMVREKGLLSLEEAVYKATLMPAQIFQFSRKGRLAPGMDADVTIFDINTICDKADYPHLGLPDAKPEGIPYVMVGGVLAVDQGRYTGAMGGKTIRK